MNAVIIPRHGGPEVLHYTQTPDPRPGPNEVLVRVRACALNHLDLWMRKGIPGRQIPLPLIPGSDIAGEVAEAGSHVKNVKTGEKIVISPGISCGHCAACAAGQDNRCRDYTILGYGKNGGYAEYVAVPAVNVMPMPADLSFEQAAAIPLVFVTAWHMLVRRAELLPGEEVLIWGAGSGVGTAAIQIAKLIGARVIATAGSDAKLAKARELGADETINHNIEPALVSRKVRDMTKRRGVDVVFDHVGVATWDQSIASLATGGRLVTCGATTGYEAQLDLRYLYSRQLSLLGSWMGSRAELHTILKLVGEKRLHPVVDRVFPLVEAAKAHERLESREAFGKVVLSVP
jgi:NADPH:quinone reductase-like Zn-dependent oxidoreductase